MSSFRRFAHFAKQRRVDVPERMPGNTRQPDAVARWCEHAVVQILRTEWRSLRGAKDEVFQRRPFAPEFLCCVTGPVSLIRSVWICVSDKSFRSCLGSRSPIRVARHLRSRSAPHHQNTVPRFQCSIRFGIYPAAPKCRAHSGYTSSTKDQRQQRSGNTRVDLILWYRVQNDVHAHR